MLISLTIEIMVQTISVQTIAGGQAILRKVSYLTKD